MAYAAIPKPSLHQNQVLYVGNATARSITGVGFQPDLLWIKDRTNANSHMLADAVRGATKYLVVDGTYAEATDSNRISAFDSDGFSIGTDNNVNQSSANDVAWNWKANGAGSLNEVGSIDSTVSVNTTSGFSIVKYTGDTSAATVGHGLGVVPKMIILKNISAVNSWFVYHHDLGATKYMVLDTTAAEAAAASIWNDTTPTSTVFSVGTTNAVSGNDFIAYCFADVKGYSKIGTYIGNGNVDAPFVYTGFKPSYILVKKTTQTDRWQIRDNARDTYNLANHYLCANVSTAETVGDGMDYLSNGFKYRASSGEVNASGQTYIYMAFASEPLVANVGASIPATAR